MTTAAPLTPLSIYVLFHPASDEGRQLAHALHDWFRLKTDEGDSSEAGLPIWFRSRLAGVESGVADPDASCELSPPIAWKEAQDNIVVVLADRHMVADRAWRFALERLAAEASRPRTLILPVEVHWSLHQLGFLTAERNAIRIGDPLPDELHGKSKELVWQQRVAQRARMLRRAVTESIARELVLGLSPSGAPERLSVFLSHAKRDGARIAEQLRDSFASFGQLKVWFDANDLPSGYAWAPSMRKAAGDLAGLVSVVTDAYPTRPWCREEVSQARTPRRQDIDEHTNAHRSIWRVRPTIAVHRAGATWSRAMAQLVHVPTIGWPGNAGETLARLGDIVDRLILEVLMASFYRRMAEGVATLPTDPDADATTHVAMLTWVPEPWSLLHVLAELIDPQAANDESGNAGASPPESWRLPPQVKRLVLAYPGYGLRTGERLELERVVHAMQRLRQGGSGLADMSIELISQERLQNGRPPEQEQPSEQTRQIAVCLSGGGDDSELEAAGVGKPHVNDCFVRIARRLLEAGCRMVYGGTLAKLEDNLTESLIDAARGWVRDRTQAGHQQPASAASLDDVPFVNYSPWPFTRFITLKHHADLVGMCRFESVYPPGCTEASLSGDDALLGSPEGAALGAEALTRMRTMTSAKEQFPVRIVVGGKIANAAGWMPGIAEEVLCALRSGQLPMVLGGFGGCAKVIADYLSVPTDPWPKALTFAGRKHDAQLMQLCQVKGTKDRARDLYAELEQKLSAFRDQLHDASHASWNFPVPATAREPIRTLLTSKSPTSCLNMITHVVGSIARP